MKLLDKPEHGSIAWLRKRHRDTDGRVVFGATDVAVLMNHSPYKTRPELFADKLGEPAVGKETAAFRRGNLLEPVLVAEAGVVLGLHFYTPQFMYQRDRFVVTLDGVDDALAPTAIIEAKTTTRYRIRGADDLPNEWLWQACARHYVTGADVYFSVLDSEQNLMVVKSPLPTEMIDAMVLEAERMAAAIEAGEPPADFADLVIDADTVARIWKPTPTSVELSTDEMYWLQQVVHAKELIAEGETLRKNAEDHIAMLLKNNETGTYKGEKVVSWKEQAGRNSLDTKALREEHPELVAKYERQGKPFRVMRTHKIASPTA